MKHFLALASLLLIAVQPAAAAISYVGGTYSQDFDTLASSGLTNTWTDDSTIPGWYSTRTIYLAGTGSNNTGGLYSFGLSPIGDRALGSVASDSTNNIIYAARLINDTGTTLTEFTLSYDGEQWRDGTNTTAHTLGFDYSVDPTSLTVGTYTPVAALNFTGPIHSGGSGALDGNAAANRVALAATITGLAWGSGQSLWVRWTDQNNASTDHGLAIDNVRIQAAVPEPASMAIWGLGALACAVGTYRRRQRT